MIGKKRVIFLFTIMLLTISKHIYAQNNIRDISDYVLLLNSTKHFIKTDLLCLQYINRKIDVSKKIDKDIGKLLQKTKYFSDDNIFGVNVKVEENYLNFVHTFYISENNYKTRCIIFEEFLFNEQLYKDFNEKGDLSIISYLSNWYEHFLLNSARYNKDYSKNIFISYFDLSNSSSKGTIKNNGIVSLRLAHDFILEKNIYYISPSSIYIKFRDDTYTVTFSIWERYLNYNKYVYKDDVELVYKFEDDATKLISESHKIILIPKRYFEGEDYNISNSLLSHPDFTNKNLKKIKLLYPDKTKLNELKLQESAIVDSVSIILLYSLWGREVGGSPIDILDVYNSFKCIPDIPSFEDIQVPFKQKVLEAYVRTWNKINNPGKIELLLEDIAPPNLKNYK